MARPNKSADKIVDAFIELIIKHDYNSLSISDITKAADVSRICFYRNFESKEQIVDRYIERIVCELQNNVSINACALSLEDYFKILFTSIGKLSPIVREIYNANLGCLMLHYFNEHLFTTPLKTQGIMLTNYERRFYTGAFYNVLIEWVMTGMREPVDKISSICCALTR